MFEPVGRVGAYVWVLAGLDCCIIAKVSTNVILDKLIVYIPIGKEIFYREEDSSLLFISFHLVGVGVGSRVAHKSENAQ